MAKEWTAEYQYQPEPSTLHSEQRLFLGVTCLAALCIGIVFGWGPFATIMEAENVFGSFCEEEQPPCDEQVVATSTIYTLATSVFLLGGLPAGLLVDRAGPMVCAITAGCTTCVASLGIGLLPGSADFLFALPFALIAAGGSLTFFTAMKVAFLLPNLQTMILTSVNALFDVSAGVPLLFYWLHEIGVSKASIFSAYGAYVAVLYALWAALFRRQALAAPGSASSTDESAEKPAKQALTAPDAIAPVDPDCSLHEALTGPKFVVPFVCFYLVHQLRCNLYLGSAKYMLRALGDSDDAYMAIFTIVLSSAALYIPCISGAIDRLSLATSMQAVNGLALVQGLLTLVPSLPSQVVTFLVFTVLRAALYSLYTVYIARTFGGAKIGTMLGISYATGAVVNLAIPPITALVLVERDGDWSVVQWAFLVTCVPQMAIMHWFARSCQDGRE